MHKNPLGRDNRERERGPHRSQEQVEILKNLATLIAARATRGRPGRASVAVQQCITQFGLYSDFKMTPQEVNRVVNLPEWTTVLELMIKSRRADLAFRTTKQSRWNQRAQDRQAHQDFLEKHRGTGKFSGKYAPQPQQTELIWTMSWGCWVELEDKDVHCKEWKCIIENFTEEEADTTVIKSMVSVQHSALITSRETGTVYELGDLKWDQVGIKQKQRGSAKYEQVRSRVTRSGHSAPHQVGTLNSISGGANVTVAASVAS